MFYWHLQLRKKPPCLLHIANGSLSQRLGLLGLGVRDGIVATGDAIVVFSTCLGDVTVVLGDAFVAL